MTLSSLPSLLLYDFTNSRCSGINAIHLNVEVHAYFSNRSAITIAPYVRLHCPLILASPRSHIVPIARCFSRSSNRVDW